MKNYISPRMTHTIISFSLAITIWMLLIFMASVTPTDTFGFRIIQIMGGSKDGVIQMLTYAAFFLGFFELLEKEKYLKNQYEGFDLRLLPLETNAKLSELDISHINDRIIDMETHGQTSLLAVSIKRVCSLYGVNRSVNDALQIVDAKIGTAKEESEGQLEIIRYIINAISALGFIGTVVGLSVAIGNSGLAKTEAGMHTITQYLYLAFDTTLVALLLGLVLNYRYHGYLERLDTFYSRTKLYIIDNLICRIQAI
jgi:MotA/TolQ/ExbB proton channel family